MKHAQVKGFAEPLLLVATQSFEGALADLVSEGLAWPDDVAIDLVERFAFGQTHVVEEELDGLVAGPVKMVQAGVNRPPGGRRATPGTRACRSEPA